MFAPGCPLEFSGHRRRLEPEVQKTGSGDFNAFAALTHIQLRQHIRGEFSWVHAALLRQADQSAGLVIAELGVRAWANRQGAPRYVRNPRRQSLFQFFLEELMEHAEKWLRHT